MMAFGKQDLIKGGEVIVDECRLVSQNGAGLDLTNHFSNINIYEDIYSNTLTGTIELVDGLNIAQHLPLMGQEVLHLTFFTPGLKKNKVKFMVNEVGTRVSDKAQKMQTYTLHLISEEHMANTNKRVSKAYEGEIDTIVEEVLREYLTEEKSFFTEPTAFTHKFVIPNWTPLRTINWLASHAVSKDNMEVSNYMFFETIDGFYLAPLSKLMQQSVKQEYRFDPSGTLQTESGKRDIFRELKNIERYTVKPSAIRDAQMAGGMFSGRLITHDLVTKKVEEKDFSYSDHFQNTPSVEKNAPVSTTMSLANSQESSFVRFAPKHNYKYDDIENNDRSESFVLERNSLIRQIKQGQGMSIIVPGDSRRRVGDIVDVKIPSAEPKQTMEQWYDVSASGKYMITQIRHAISNKDYKLFLDLSRDSAMQAFPDVKTSMI